MQRVRLIVDPGPVVPVYSPEDSRSVYAAEVGTLKAPAGERHPSDGLPGGSLRHPQFVADADAAAGIPPGGG